MTVPGKFRRLIDSGDPDRREGERTTLILVYGHGEGPYLEGYTSNEMSRLEDKIDRLNDGEFKEEMVDKYITKSLDVEIDPDGRLVIPQQIREDFGLGIETNALFLGKLSTFQIWSQDVYEAQGPRTYTRSDPNFDVPKQVSAKSALDSVLRQMDEK